MRGPKIIAGSSHPDLCQLILNKLSIPPVKLSKTTLPNHESHIDITSSVRNEDVYIVQSSSDYVNDHFMELLILVNACKLASAKRVIAVLPSFPYSKQSKKKKARAPITAKLLASMLRVAGVDHIITMDLHSYQMQGFFNLPVDNFFSEPTIVKYIRDTIPDYETGVVVSKNPGGAKRVTSFAGKLCIDFALIHGGRYRTNGKCTVDKEATDEGLDEDKLEDGGSPGTTTTSVFGEDVKDDRLNLVGDVKGRIAFILDDMITDSKSFVDAATLLIYCGAKLVYLIATHGIFSGNALQEFEECEAVHQVIVTNTHPVSNEKKAQTTKLQIIDISPTLAEAIRRTHNGESISYLFHNCI